MLFVKCNCLGIDIGECVCLGYKEVYNTNKNHSVIFNVYAQQLLWILNMYMYYWVLLQIL